ncbi:MAG: hypothetical protein ABR532_02320 [Candidatus Dormibacteria bacterium]
MGVENGMDALRDRMQRKPRTAVVPRHEAIEVPTSDHQPSALTEPELEQPLAPPKSRSRPAPKPIAPTGGLPLADEPFSNMTLRVRTSLDMRASDLVHEMKYRHNVRTSKAELVEMLLSDLPTKPSDALIARVRAFQREAPRP